VRVDDVSLDPGVPEMTDLIGKLSSAPSADAVFRSFMAGFGKVRPVHYFIGIVPEESGEGYRVSYEVPVEAVVEGKVAAYRQAMPGDARHLPVRSGGFAGEALARRRPQFVSELDLRDDPVFGARLAGMKTCMVLPVYEGTKVIEWALAFSRVPDATLLRANFTQAMIVANLVTLAINHTDAITRIGRLNMQLRDQFDQVARLQQQLLPRRTPDVPGLQIATSYLTSDQAGGDYFDFLEFPGDRWGLLIADVSGHGAAAATVMAMMHAIIHAYPVPHTLASPRVSPDEILTYANRRLMQSGLDGNFVTAWLGIWEPEHARLTFSNAGHPPPRIKHLGGQGASVVELDGDATFPLGISDVLDAQSTSRVLRPGDTLVLYTDGITEAFDASRRMFSSAGLDRALVTCSGEVDCVIESVHGALYEHTRARTRADDQTLVAVRHTGQVGL
jgi:sigma-B regulation protein RsbU (phosphoserine phosphatase)